MRVARSRFLTVDARQCDERVRKRCGPDGRASPSGAAKPVMKRSLDDGNAQRPQWNGVHIVSMLLIAVWFLAGCAHELAPPDDCPTQEWRRASPESQGIDSTVLVEVLSYIRDKALPVHSLLIARRGYLVMDETFDPYTDGLRHDIASVTKSITATLVGMAIDEGYISTVDAGVHDVLGGFNGRDLKPFKQQMTVGHLLSMSSGLECGYEPGEPELFEMRKTNDWITYTLALPMRTQPGTEFAYCSSGMHLLSAIVTRVTGQSLEAFAAIRLFRPLGIQDWYWPADPAGVSHGWGDLQLHPRDMAKIGLLYLYKGQWEGRQVVAADWIAQATRPHVNTSREGVSYGYGWWRSELSGLTLIAAQGRGGQRIVIWPEKELVVVLTAGGVDTDELAPFLARAVRSSGSFPENPAAAAKLKDTVAALNAVPPAQPVGNLPVMAARISGRWYWFDRNRLGLDGLTLNFHHLNPEVGLRIDGRRYEFPIGLDGVYRFLSQGRSTLPTGVKGRWTGQDTFVFEYDEIGGINHFTFRLRFTDDSVSVTIDDPTGLHRLTLTGQKKVNDPRQ
ncbi:MAG: beta-lactamase family protein [Candidatus Tectomicrobia bacterium]|nr:beta-lactamase family protein [Candidatus Tectomicrobia bacterium]